MKYKADTLFCNVREHIVKNAKPTLNPEVVKEWFHHQRERTKIFYKKEILKERPPWTTDPILGKYKFVNTKRKWDKETRWLLVHVIDNPSMSYEDKLLNCFLFRVINKGETLDLLGGPIEFKKLTLAQINSEYRYRLAERERHNPKYVFFSAAYILGGPKVNFGKAIQEVEGKAEENMILRMIKFVYYNKNSILQGVSKARSQLDVYSHLMSFSGIGKFLSYQIFIDFTYLKEFPFTEHNFVISGPGCERGINWLFSNRDGMTSEECLFWFTLNQFEIAKKYNEIWLMDELFHFLPKDERIYTLMDMENSGACEVDKRCRTIFSGKRPKQKYKFPEPFQKSLI
ncbi:hypothetical protein AHAT_26240 [Agarivorans sp. Toyoura001]|uniref:nucleotide kinase domain-containing protein n=1 Tax=Agarivorans sp. Toyoura001 TaxID=2283141 RepID=UPI0010EF8BA0|nr:nucleotide kinase domain-containing protein [Agarivorans sp. Toyoura001]GDY26734.1 hypothetical protein AHAT_26240 [Agarivorans sp. Toyoura001]